MTGKGHYPVSITLQQGWSYEFQETAEGWSQCYKRPLPVKAPLQCVPGFASPVLGNQDDVPGQLGTEPWDVWRADQDNLGVTLTYGFARDSCRPAFIRQRGQLHNSKMDTSVTECAYFTLIRINAAVLGISFSFSFSSKHRLSRG